MAGWAILPLRAFLGVTFLFAGLQKLANPNFFNPQNPSGIQAQLIASERISPLHALLGHLLHLATPVGVLIALGEVAVGMGALLGLWTRLAALGGMALSFALFLTVSLHSSPYYTGADIVFLFAWTPLVVAGAGGVLSLDAVLASRAHEEVGLGTPTRVPVRFSVVQGVCGNYHDGRCRARSGEACSPTGCPFLEERPGRAERRAATEVRRRTVGPRGRGVRRDGGRRALHGGLAAAVGRLVGGAKPPAGAGTATLGPAVAFHHHHAEGAFGHHTLGHHTIDHHHHRPRRHGAGRDRRRPGGRRAGRRGGPVHRPGQRRPGPGAPARSRGRSWPSTRSAPTPGARSATPRPPASSSAPATARSSTRQPGRWRWGRPPTGSPGSP